MIGFGNYNLIYCKNDWSKMIPGDCSWNFISWVLNASLSQVGCVNLNEHGIFTYTVWLPVTNPLSSIGWDGVPYSHFCFASPYFEKKKKQVEITIFPIQIICKSDQNGLKMSKITNFYCCVTYYHFRTHMHHLLKVISTVIKWQILWKWCSVSHVSQGNSIQYSDSKLGQWISTTVFFNLLNLSAPSYETESSLSEDSQEYIWSNFICS